MFLYETNYICAYSCITFDSIVQFLNEYYKRNSKYIIFFMDGNNVDIMKTYNMISSFNEGQKEFIVVTLINDSGKHNPFIRQISDIILDKKISYYDLKTLMRILVSKSSKLTNEDIRDNIFSRALRTSHKENMVMNLLANGYSHSDVANILHMSIKTVSNYKSRTLKRFGAKNLNDLYILNKQ